MTPVMLNLTTFGSGVLALLAVWKFMLRPAIQDAFKDALFDVRDNLRCHFAKAGQLETMAYRELRDSLNGYIRFIEEANLALTYRFATQLDQQPRVAELYSKELDRRFDVKIPELARLARASRRRCGRIIQLYVFHSSLVSVAIIYLVLLPLAIGHESYTFCRVRAARSWKSFWISVKRYMAAKEDRAIEPQHTELFSQLEILKFAIGYFRSTQRMDQVSC